MGRVVAVLVLIVVVLAGGTYGLAWATTGSLYRAVVVVRLGERRGDVDWLTLAREVAGQVG